VFLAGGVGITPMLSMLRTLADRGDTREHLLLVSGRTVQDLLYRTEIARLSRRLSLTVVEAVDQPPEGWAGVVGRIDADVLAGVLPPPRLRKRLHYFLCGPPPMVAGLAATLRGLGVPVTRIHTELFDMV
jgi:ferredoxin-NADP reductase